MGIMCLCGLWPFLLSFRAKAKEGSYGGCLLAQEVNGFHQFYGLL